MKLKRVLVRLTVIALMWLGGVLGWIWVGPDEPAHPPVEFAVVLGAAVSGDRPSPVFQARIDHAIGLLRDREVKQIIFTGGMGEGDALGEAQAAQEYALAKGVPAGALLIEERSRTTMENLAFAQPFVLEVPDSEIVVVSDPLHLRGAMQMADALGYEAYPSATDTTRYRSLSTKLPFAMREVYFIHHFWLFGE